MSSHLIADIWGLRRNCHPVKHTWLAKTTVASACVADYKPRFPAGCLAGDATAVGVRALPRWLKVLTEGSKMPKLKTKSSVKRRFRRTGTGKILMNVAYKRHNLSSKSKKMKRQARGTKVMSEADMTIVRQFMPYDR